MKQGWTYKKLGEVCRFFSGFAFKSNKFTENGMPIIRISDIKNGEIDDTNVVYFNPSDYEQDLSRYIIYPGEILIAKYGGTTGKIGRNKTNKEFYLNQRVGAFRENKSIIEHDYLFYYLLTKSKESLRIAAGAAQPNLSSAQINNFIIPVPSLTEQERIVERLDAAFAQIDELKSNAEKQLAEARALFQSALTQAMQPKPGWQEKTLGDITTSMADGPFGSNLKKEHYTDIPEVRIIQLSNIGEDGWREENTKYTTFNHLQTIQRSEVLPGDIVIAKMMPAGRAILCPSHETKFVLSSDAVRATLKDGLNRRFVLYSINSPYFRKQVYENVSGSGRVRTSLTKLRACKLFIPNKDVQDKVVKLLDSLSENIRLLEELHHKTAVECDALKQALLRQIFE